MKKFLQLVDYSSPSWAASLKNPPLQKISLGNFPTPIFPFSPPGVPKGIQMYIKRDDFSGVEISGNKARKLEFLLADAKSKNANCIVTCGGLQSNHCRATAVAARMLGLDAYLLLRCHDPDTPPGLIGNLLLDRLIGSHLLLLSKNEFTKYGSEALIESTCSKLVKKNLNPYPIPVGGSNALGTWGYIDFVAELGQQLEEYDLPITDVAMACGSGGTAAGISLGLYLYSKQNPKKGLRYADNLPVHSYSVCDTPEYFYEYINNKILSDLSSSTINSRNLLQIKWVNVYSFTYRSTSPSLYSNAKGKGYALSTPEELIFIKEVAETTGVALDPVYSGKALFHLIKDLQKQPQKFSGTSILFIHTGGLMGLYEQSDILEELVTSKNIERFSF